MIRAGLVAQALEGYDLEAHEQSVETAEEQRVELISRFPRDAWPELRLEDYALGQSDNPDNFCRWMEFRATELGSIRGGSSRKHHIYRESDSGEWWFERDRYETVEEAWVAVRDAFIEAIAAGAAGEWERIDNIPALRGGPALVAKTLHVYFPEDVLPVYSHTHLQHFLAALGEDSRGYGDLRTVALNRMLLEELRGSGEVQGWTTKQIERLLYGTDLSPAAAAPQGGPIPDIPGFIEKTIDEYGDGAIEARRSAEDKARRMLDAAAGAMTESQLRELMRFFNVDFHNGKESKTRFSPAFVGATANRLAENLEGVNLWTNRLWKGDGEALDELLSDRKLLPSSGTSYPSMLMYLRDPQRFAVWLQPTDHGLQRLFPSYEPAASPGAGDSAAYRAFSAAATTLMRDHEIPPELLDAVLAAAARAEVASESETIGEEPPSEGGSGTWIFQANPSLYDIDRAVSEESRLFWVLRQNKSEIRKGDRVYLWRSGTEAGVIARATVLTDPVVRTDPLAATYAPDSEEMSRPEPRVQLEVEPLPGPLLRTQLIDDPVLSDLDVIRRPNATNFRVSAEQDAALRALLDEPRQLAIPSVAAETADSLLLPLAFLQEAVDLMVDKGQVIFYGPPGTGKTRIALDLAKELTRDGGAYEVVQFHPSYAYENFVGGFRPKETSGGTGIQYERANGPLRLMAQAAREEPRFPFVLIVDEINRGNVPRIFGELLFLLEYRRRGIKLQYWPEESFSLPSNLFLIGTMNTADRSIALVDAALRRRFAFVEFAATKAPVSEVLRRWLERHGLDPEPAVLLDRLNRVIGDDEFAIGPSYFLSTEPSQPDLESIWRHEIMPLLAEHYYGTTWNPESYSLKQLRNQSDDSE
jgi:MoxR-like ATPase